MAHGRWDLGERGGPWIDRMEIETEANEDSAFGCSDWFNVIVLFRALVEVGYIDYLMRHLVDKHSDSDSVPCSGEHSTISAALAKG